jgi:hypothetical protein
MPYLRSKIRNLLACRQAVSAAVLSFALLCGAVMPTIKLALPEPVSCGMDCCLEEGVCCCLLAFTEQHDDEKPVLAQAELSNACPPHCATAPSASPTLTPKAERQRPYDFLSEIVLNRPHESQQRTIANLSCSSARPRAPPVSPLILAV